VCDDRGLGQTQVRVTGIGFSENPDRQEDRFRWGVPAANQGLDASFLFHVAQVFDEAEEC
jgi:hypothetical protein